MSGHELWRIVVAWVLWTLPLFLGSHLFWRWCSDSKKPTLLKISVLVLAGLAFTTGGAFSILDAAKPRFIIVRPGLVFPDGSTRAYYLVARRQTFHNVDIMVHDNTDVTRQLQFTLPQMDPRKGGIARYFRFNPDNLGHERMTIIIQSADGDTDQDLQVETRGDAKFPSFKTTIKNSRTGKILFECQSLDFRHGSVLADCGHDAFAGQ